MDTEKELPEKMCVDAALVRDAAMNVGGGFNHGAVQITAAYQMAVARYNHRNSRVDQRAALLGEIAVLETRLYAMGRKK